jgi:hypothetical protein
LRAALGRLPLLVGFFAAVFFLDAFPLAGAAFFEDRAVDAGEGFFLAVALFLGEDRDAPFGAAFAAALVFRLAPRRFFAAPIIAPETAPIAVPKTGIPKAVPATAPAAAPPNVLVVVLLLVPSSSSDFLVSSISASLIALASLLRAAGVSE